MEDVLSVKDVIDDQELSIEKGTTAKSKEN